MATLEELQAKYGTERHLPNPDCPKCKGEGEFYFEGQILSGWKPCHCIYIEHSMCELFVESMNETLRKIKAEMGR